MSGYLRKYTDKALTDALTWTERHVLEVKAEIERRKVEKEQERKRAFVPAEKALLVCGLLIPAIKHYLARMREDGLDCSLKAAKERCDNWLAENPGRFVLPQD